MALLFDSTTDRVNCGSASGIDNLSPITVLAWFYPTNVAANHYDRIVSKLSSGSGWDIQISDDYNGNHPNSGSLNFEGTGYDSATTPDNTIIQDAWNFFGGTWAGVGNVPKIYWGDLSNLATELTPFTTSNTLSSYDDSSLDLLIGHRHDLASSGNFRGSIAVIGLFEEVLTEAQIQSFQFRPRIIGSNCKGLWFPGLHGATNVPDFSGNGNDGTGTNVTVSAHVPLGPPFGFDFETPCELAGISIAALAKNSNIILQPGVL